MRASLRVVASVLAIGAGAGAAVLMSMRSRGPADGPMPPGVVAFAEVGTSRAELDQLDRTLAARIMANPQDDVAAVRRAEVLLRRARVESNGGFTAEAARVLAAVLDREPDDYNALRMLGAVRLSQHRFRQAIELAQRAMRTHPKDAWNFGVLGDAHLELGEYEQAFAAFDTMVGLRPDAAAYARIAYAQELQGRLPEALRAMALATEATGARDAESLAWHHAQLGMLRTQMQALDEADREFAHADFIFPGYPYARLGRARLAVARGDLENGLKQYRSVLSDRPTADAALSAAEILVDLGRGAEAEALFARAEALEREGWRSEAEQPANLARILATRGVRVEEAVALAENASKSRSDILTMDTLAWAYYRAGRFADAHAASVQARRTGSRDARILTHAAAIDAAAAE